MENVQTKVFSGEIIFRLRLHISHIKMIIINKITCAAVPNHNNLNDSLATASNRTESMTHDPCPKTAKMNIFDIACFQ